eukprot:gnl/TRDRNA2_/TRDRNA2_132255_c0_seq1.p1 gnl/TRDRNA2_/TRDRNA2_132255_c0~~gnl/TRDRNA2_/TRDRNA2_132255_c0_seq1.p1  ORF type:complete len:499 (-),score=131.79 gnl/TRDRNA2_/TRDRNA2_132255_c0_seq1:18-1328(-)
MGTSPSAPSLGQQQPPMPPGPPPSRLQRPASAGNLPRPSPPAPASQPQSVAPPSPLREEYEAAAQARREGIPHPWAHLPPPLPEPPKSLAQVRDDRVPLSFMDIMNKAASSPPTSSRRASPNAEESELSPEPNLEAADAADESAEDVFDPEELQLDREIEQALKELEAAVAASEALQLHLENEEEDADASRTEADQLRAVVAEWEKAAVESRKDLAERQARVKEMQDTLRGPGDAKANTAVAVKRETKRLDLANDRVRVLEAQVARLQDQVVEQQAALKTYRDEKVRLEQQVQELEQMREGLRNEQRDGREATRAMEAQMKSREEAVENTSKRRQTLERQALQLKGEANGVRVRLSAASARGTPRSSTSQGSDVACTDKAMPEAEDVRTTSLRLQREIVNLWAAMKSCDEQIHELQGAQNLGGLAPGSEPRTTLVS